MYTFFSVLPQVTSNDKTPTVISSALEKHNQNTQEASKYELIQLLPEGKGDVTFFMSYGAVFFFFESHPKMSKHYSGHNDLTVTL